MIEGLHCGDCRELSKQIPDESVDLIFTDPPYIGKYLYLYEWLASEAERILKPGGCVAFYCGHYYLNQIFDYFNQTSLDYFFTFNSMNDRASVIWQRKVLSKAKSIVIFSKGKYKPRCNTMSVCSTKKEKVFHEWGQPAEEARYWIDCMTEQGDLIVDPMAGGGTVPVVCEYLDRKWIAFEIESASCDTIRERIQCR